VNIDLFDFELDKSRIALIPVHPRDQSKLLYLDDNKQFHNKIFCELPTLLNAGDTLVINETKVIPTFFEVFRLRGANRSKIKVNLIKKISNNVWLILAKPKKRLIIGDHLLFSNNDNVIADIISFEKEDHIKIKFNIEEGDLDDWLFSNGQVPLPPYITSQRNLQDNDKESYQTVYATQNGSVAAPTAGLHFTNELISQLIQNGVNICKVVLHVGSGTFTPIKVENVKDHNIHSEWCYLSEDAALLLNKTRSNNKKIIAVGTTSMRILETAVDDSGNFSKYIGDTDIYITPGFNFRAADAMITNFHLPKSSLFVLVCAYYGINDMQRAYKFAIENNYRFYSYGDACFIMKDNNV
jgi:S-adenosylmethionine:tRNA ribosyltransferase-isomerase